VPDQAPGVVVRVLGDSASQILAQMHEAGVVFIDHAVPPKGTRIIVPPALYLKIPRESVGHREARRYLTLHCGFHNSNQQE
jgi:hypothetical protein